MLLIRHSKFSSSYSLNFNFLQVSLAHGDYCMFWIQALLQVNFHLNYFSGPFFFSLSLWPSITPLCELKQGLLSGREALPNSVQWPARAHIKRKPEKMRKGDRKQKRDCQTAGQPSAGLSSSSRDLSQSNRISTALKVRQEALFQSIWILNPCFQLHRAKCRVATEPILTQLCLK